MIHVVKRIGRKTHLVGANRGKTWCGRYLAFYQREDVEYLNVNTLCRVCESTRRFKAA